ncbi:MAG: 50S ribosomal protein L33 [Elusimicrobia bacterium]|nr:50S ribosomal protein L33 [Elusimicrobiota bacterium]
MGDRVVVILACTGCKNKNYTFIRGKKKEYKLEKNKFCKACGKSVLHKEAK